MSLVLLSCLPITNKTSNTFLYKNLGTRILSALGQGSWLSCRYHTCQNKDFFGRGALPLRRVSYFGFSKQSFRALGCSQDSRWFSSASRGRKKIPQDSHTILGKVKSAASWLFMILTETPAEAVRRRDGEFLARLETPVVEDTLTTEQLKLFKEDPVSFRNKYRQELEKNVNLELRYSKMSHDLAMNENFLKSKMTSEQLVEWDLKYNAPDGEIPTDKQQSEKNLEVSRQITVLQSRRILYNELQSGTVNPFVRPKVEGDPVVMEDLSMESRIIPDEYDPTLDEPIVHIDTRKPEGAGYVSDYNASRFYEFFGEKNPLPDGYFYFNEAPILSEEAADRAVGIQRFDEQGAVIEGTLDEDESKHLVLRSLHAETLKESTAVVDAADRAASVRSIGGYIIKEHFDVSMVRKTPENLVLLENDRFLREFNIDLDRHKTEEAKRLEMLILDTADSAKARPINKHVAFFKKPHEAREDVQEFIKTKTETMRLEMMRELTEESYFWKFISWLGYPQDWRKERYARWQAFLEERSARLLREAEVNKGKIKLDLTESGEVPNPEEIPEEFFGRDSFHKPAYFERRSAKYPGRYNNVWYDKQIVDLLEPPYNLYEHFTFVVFEQLERAYAEGLQSFVPSDDYLPFEPTIETSWLDPSVAEMIESDFAILPGHRMEEWASLFYGRWDDILFTSDYQRCVDIYDDLVRMEYPRRFWWESYHPLVKKLMLWSDIFLHTIFLVCSVVYLNWFALLLYFYFCGSVELVKWD